MSSTVGYGAEVVQSGSPGYEEELEYNLAEQLGLTVVVSRAEYGNEERFFVFATPTVAKAGDSSTATFFSTKIPEGVEELINKYVNETGLSRIGDLGWHLVDYYVYS